MPGTGKTHFIIELIDYLIKEEKKILLSTFTNQALDNIVNKLAEKEYLSEKIIRISGNHVNRK